MIHIFSAELLRAFRSPGRAHDRSDRLGTLHSNSVHQNPKELQSSSHVQANQCRLVLKIYFLFQQFYRLTFKLVQSNFFGKPPLLKNNNSKCIVTIWSVEPCKNVQCLPHRYF